ncbi:MAG: bile acid:sodium symporter [Gemmatimonadota bacterium]
MNLASLIPLALQSSIFAIVLALGLGVTFSDAMWGFRHPRALGRTALAMFVIMPLVAVALAKTFTLEPAVAIALVALSLSTVPPILPNKELKAGGEASRAIGLLVAVSLASIVITPLGVSLVGGWFGREASVPVALIARIVALTIMVPLVVGLLVGRLAPVLADRVAGAVGRIGAVLLLLGVVLILVRVAPMVWTLLGNWTLVAIVLFVAIGLAAGHLLAGGREQDRTVLSLSTATRHPAIAMAVAHAAVPGAEGVGAAVILYLVVGAIVSGVYLSARQKRAGAGAPSPSP